MKKTKQQLIEEHKSKPFEVGDRVYIEWTTKQTKAETIHKGRKKETVYTEYQKDHSAKGTVLEVFDESVSVDFSNDFISRIPQSIGVHSKGDIYLVNKSSLNHSILNVGVNHFADGRYSLNYMQQDMSSLLHYMDIDKFKQDRDGYGGIDFDPYVIDANGEHRYFQRGYVWTLEQKQQLIDSIYNQMDIGKFVLSYVDWKEIKRKIDAGEPAYNVMCIDGKQRMNAIKDFIEGAFPDSYGDYWDDMSAMAQNEFRSKNVSVCMLDSRSVTPAFIKHIFLAVNNTGTPVSKEHIDYVKSINV